MELASLIKFAFVLKSREKKVGYESQLLFFTPCEELHGSSIFSKLSPNYGLVQPHLDKLNLQLLTLIN